MFRLKKKDQREMMRITEYLVTGGAWFWSGYLVFAICYSGLKLGIVLSKIISYIFGLSVNFLLQRYWVFADSSGKKQATKVTGRYVALATLNLGIDTLIVWSLAKAGLTPYIGQFVSAGFFTVWNYIWYKLWVFTKGTKPANKHQAAPVLRRSKHVRPVVKRKKK